MDEQGKDYLLDQAMGSIASFAAASRMARKKLDNMVFQGGALDMSTEEVLEYLLDFMDIESDTMFKEYDSCFSTDISKETTYIELIPEAPFNPENKEDTISALRDLHLKKSFHLIQIYDKNNKPRFITIDEFERKYYEYWELVFKRLDYTEEQIEKFKQGKK